MGREGEGERETHTHRDRDREREKDRQTDRQTDGRTDRQRNKPTGQRLTRLAGFVVDKLVLFEAECGSVFHVVDVVNKLISFAVALADDLLPVVHSVNTLDSCAIIRSAHQRRIPARDRAGSGNSGTTSPYLVDIK